MNNTDIDTSASSVDQIHAKLDNILNNQAKIISKLNQLGEIKEEVKSIKKILTAHSLALSTIESYISDLMIIIPGSGKDESKSSKEVNPELKMVIGRENTRGLEEVRDRSNKNNKFGESITGSVQLDERYIISDLDFGQNNAANFKPQDDFISLEIIYAIIDKEVKDKEKGQKLKRLVEKSVDAIPVESLYSYVVEYLETHPAD